MTKPATPLASPISDQGELVRFLHDGARPSAEHRLGVEHEKIGVKDGGVAPAYDDGIRAVLDALAGTRGWSPIVEDGHPIGLKRADGASVSLEPGGQFEFSDAPRATAADAGRAVDEHLAELAGAIGEVGISWLAVGFRPFGRREDVPWMPKGRYRVMREWMPRHGTRGLEMMGRTATVQANLDFASQADAAAKVRAAMGISPIVTALWAASPIVDGAPAGFQSYRAFCWLDTDETRCGLLPFVFADDAGERLFERYVDWALDVPMFFVYRDKKYLPFDEDFSFRRFLAEGWHGERATLADWDLHLSTLFPEVRLRPHVEVRSADASTRGLVQALPALYRGLLYDAEARDAAWELVAKWPLAERHRLRRQVPKTGLATHAPDGGTLLDRGRELVAIARHGLARLGDDTALLDAVADVATSGRSRADVVLDAWNAAAGDARKFVDAIRL